ncbi:TIGR03086 family metal-binding protein [Nesterenkonia sp. F]|uniref:TIGR03086 family metal-binding protein n=1 Tax=Nesterenkonia sp. F TaxID=795955 RepID=UPI000255D14B|nr:TIGR03086 family metal-binding protein [Nesterenkonia sp. F]
MSLPDQPAARHRSVAATFSEHVAGVEDWDAPAPVPGWRARDVVGHLTRWFPEFLRPDGLELPPGPDDSVDPVGAWEHLRNQVQELLEGPESRRSFSHPELGTMPLEVAVDRYYTPDVFMHTWDLGRAAGQDVQLDEDYSAELLAGLDRMDDALRASGQFGPRVPVPADAPVQERLAGFIGRDPFWRR